MDGRGDRGGAKRSFLSSPHFSLQADNTYQEHFPPTVSARGLAAQKKTRSYSVIPPTSQGLASAKWLSGKREFDKNGDTVTPMMEQLGDIADLDSDGRFGLSWQVLSTNHCKRIAEGLKRDLVRVEKIVVKELNHRESVVTRPYSARDQRKHIAKVALPQDKDMKLVWLEPAEKKRLLTLRHRMTVLEKYLRRLMMIPVPEFASFHAKLYENVLDSIMLFVEATKTHVFYFERYFALKAHHCEILSKIKYHTHDLEMAEKTYVELLQRIFLTRLRENVRANKHTISLMQGKRKRIYFLAWARKVSVTHIMRGRVSIKEAQEEISGLAEDVRARTANMIEPLSIGEIATLPNVHEFVNAHPAYEHMYSKPFLKDACDHVDETVRWMLQATAHAEEKMESGSTKDGTKAAAARRNSGGTSTATTATVGVGTTQSTSHTIGVGAQRGSDGHQRRVSTSRGMSRGQSTIHVQQKGELCATMLDKSSRRVFKKHFHRESRTADAAVQVTLATYASTGTQFNSLPQNADHWYMPEVYSKRDPMLQSELHRAVIGYSAQQRHLEFETGRAMRQQHTLNIANTLLVASMILGQKQWHDDKSDHAMMHRDSLQDCINRYFTMHCLEDAGTPETLRGRFLASLHEHRDTSARVAWFSQACGRDGRSQHSLVHSVCDFLLFVMRSFRGAHISKSAHRHLVQLGLDLSPDEHGLDFQDMTVLFGQPESEVPSTACVAVAVHVLKCHVPESELANVKRKLHAAAAEHGGVKQTRLAQRRESVQREQEQRKKEITHLQGQQLIVMQRLKQRRLAQSSDSDLQVDANAAADATAATQTTTATSPDDIDADNAHEVVQDVELEVEVQRRTERVEGLKLEVAAPRKLEEMPPSLSLDQFLDIVMASFLGSLRKKSAGISSMRQDAAMQFEVQRPARTMTPFDANFSLKSGGTENKMTVRQLRLLCGILVPDLDKERAVKFLSSALDGVGRTVDELGAFVVDMSPVLRHDELLQALAEGSGGVDTTGDGYQDARADDGTEAHRILRDSFIKYSNCAPARKTVEDILLTGSAARAAAAAKAAEARRDPLLLYAQSAATLAATRISAAKLKLLIQDQGLLHEELLRGDPEGHCRRVMKAIDEFTSHRGDPLEEHHYVATAAEHPYVACWTRYVDIVLWRLFITPHTAAACQALLLLCCKSCCATGAHVG